MSNKKLNKPVDSKKKNSKNKKNHSNTKAKSSKHKDYISDFDWSGFGPFYWD